MRRPVDHITKAVMPTIIELYEEHRFLRGDYTRELSPQAKAALAQDTRYRPPTLNHATQQRLGISGHTTRVLEAAWRAGDNAPTTLIARLANLTEKQVYGRLTNQLASKGLITSTRPGGWAHLWTIPDDIKRLIGIPLAEDLKQQEDKPVLTDRVVQFVKANPGCTTRDIMGDTGGSKTGVTRALQRLTTNRIVHCTTHVSEGGHTTNHWELTKWAIDTLDKQEGEG